MSPAKGDMAAKVFESIGKFGLALAIAGGVVNSALYNMDAGHRAVIFDGFGGVQDIVIEEGTHFLIPWVQKPIIFDCRSQPHNVPVNTGSKDLQKVIIILGILFWLASSQLPRIFPSTGEDYDESVLPVQNYRDPPVRGGSAGKLITQRELAPRRVSDDLTERAATFGLILDELSLTFGKFTERWKPNRWLSRKQRGPDWRRKRLGSKRRKPSSLWRVTSRQRSGSPAHSQPPLPSQPVIQRRKREAAEDIA